MLPRVQGLDIQEIPPETPYIELELKPVQLLSHYHKIYYIYNTTLLKQAYYSLLSNYIIINNQMGNTTLSVQLHREMLALENQIFKITQTRQKRGIINGVGTIIKWVTGNPDNNDLENLQKELEIRKENQNILKKEINSVTTIAKQTIDRYEKELNIIKQNENETRLYLERVQSRIDHLYLEFQFQSQISLLKDHVLIIERTINAIQTQNINLELFQYDEINTLLNQLQDLYSSQLLFNKYNHIYEFLQKCKMNGVGTSDTVTFILNVPILRPTVYQTKRIVPIPNMHNMTLKLPANYLLENEYGDRLWTNENCKDICYQPTGYQNFQCNLRDLSTCETINVKLTRTNTLQLYDEVIVISHNVIHGINQCKPKSEEFSIKKTSIIRNYCNLYINNEYYINRNDTFRIKLPEVVQLHVKTKQKLYLLEFNQTNVNNIQQKLLEIKDETLLIHATTHVTLTIILSIIMLCAFICIILYYLYKKCRKENIECNEDITCNGSQESSILREEELHPLT